MKKYFIIIILFVCVFITGCGKKDTAVKQGEETKKGELVSVSIGFVNKNTDLYFKLDLEKKEIQYNGTVNGEFHKTKTATISNNLIKDVKDIIYSHNAEKLQDPETCYGAEIYKYSVGYSNKESYLYNYCGIDEEDDNYIFVRELVNYLRVIYEI